MIIYQFRFSTLYENRYLCFGCVKTVKLNKSRSQETSAKRSRITVIIIIPVV
jgi:hypothetical protein